MTVTPALPQQVSRTVTKWQTAKRGLYQRQPGLARPDRPGFLLQGRAGGAAGAAFANAQCRRSAANGWPAAGGSSSAGKAAPGLRG